MTKRALAALVACFAIAAAAAGCGGGGDSTSSGGDGGQSGSAPTKAAFVKEADAVCKAADSETNSEIESFAKENGISLKKEPTKDQQVEIYEAVVIPSVEKQGEEIEALTPPEGEEQKVEEILDALDEGVEDAEANPEQLAEGKNPLADASAKARAYGMKSCGSE